ncbi:MAG: CRISPR-associated endonuclease Cas2 [Alicyclobacillaceae bacterium]|nr:CRISPR-associated endonuclease Cas2 [Alicyclobacillaceae bacterium]
MFVLVTYDVCTETKEGEKRLRRIAKVCQGVGQRVQKSVFECDVDEIHYAELVRRLSRIMDKSEDNIRIYVWPGSKPKTILQLGRSTAVDFRGPLVL